MDSDEVADDVVLDLDAAGHLVGIDIEHASERVELQRLGLNQRPSRVETGAA